MNAAAEASVSTIRADAITAADPRRIIEKSGA